jgi:hypothetical protein
MSALNEYRQFVKNHIHEFNHLPKQTDRMKAVASLYRKHKGMPAKPKMAKPKMAKHQAKGGEMADESGSGFLSSALDAIGLGLHEKKRGRPKKHQAKGGVITASGLQSEHAGNFFDDLKKGFMMPFEAVGHLAPVLAHLV